MPFNSTAPDGNVYSVEGANSQEEADNVIAEKFGKTYTNQNTTVVPKTTPSLPPETFNVTAPDGNIYPVTAHTKQEAQDVINEWHQHQIQVGVNKNPNREKVSSLPGITDATMPKLMAQGFPVFGNYVKDTPAMAQYKEDHPTGAAITHGIGTYAPSAILAAATAGQSLPVQLGLQGGLGAVTGFGNTLTEDRKPNNPVTGKELATRATINALGNMAGPVTGKLLGMGANAVGRAAVTGTSPVADATISSLFNLGSQLGTGHSLDPITAALAGYLGKPAFDIAAKAAAPVMRATSNVANAPFPGVMPGTAAVTTQHILDAIYNKK